jgi:hypothetical protein
MYADRRTNKSYVALLVAILGTTAMGQLDRDEVKVC